MARLQATWLLAVLATFSAAARNNVKVPRIAGDPVPPSLDTLVQIGIATYAGDFYACSGILLSPGYVLSNAACFVDDDREPLDMAFVGFTLGGYIPTLYPESMALHVPPNYHPNNQEVKEFFSGNIALVYVPELARLGLDLNYPRLPEDREEVNNAPLLVASGVGVDGSQKISGKAMFATMQRLGGLGEAGNFTDGWEVETDHFLAANGTTGVCAGDAGAPLLIPSKSWAALAGAPEVSNEQDVIIGVESWGGGGKLPCGDPGSYDAYVDVLTYAEWIRDVMAPEGDAPWIIRFGDGSVENDDNDNDNYTDDDEDGRELAPEQFAPVTFVQTAP